MKNYFLPVLAITVLLFNGCATKGDIDITRSEIDAVKTRLFSAERDIGGLRNESKEGIGTVEKNFKSDVAAVRKIAADIQATIDANRTELQAMNGKIDDMDVKIKKPSEELGRYRIDADKRIVSLEERILRLQTVLDDLAKKMSGVTQKLETPNSAEGWYQKAMETFKTGDMQAARDAFNKFIELYPKNELAANAYYWIGETHYSEKSFEPSILAFQETIKNFPDSDKVPAAMLKQALAFKSINDAKSAKYVLKKLVEAYPKSEEAKKAKSLLK